MERTVRACDRYGTVETKSRPIHAVTITVHTESMGELDELATIKADLSQRALTYLLRVIELAIKPPRKQGEPQDNDND